MKKFLLSLAVLGMLFSAAPVFAQEECLKPAQLVLMTNSEGLKSVALDGSAMGFFMQEFEKIFPKAPVEYDLIVIITDEERAQIVLFKDGCKVTQTRVLPAGV